MVVKNKLILSLLLAMLVILVILPSGCKRKNRAPDTPVKPTGQSQTYEGKSETYKTKAKDPDNDDVRYIWDWGDGQGFRDTTDYHASDEEISLSHAWQNSGSFVIKVKAQDTKEQVSSESEGLTVTVLYNAKPQIGSISGPSSALPGIYVQFSTVATDSTDSVKVKFMYRKTTATTYTSQSWIGPKPSGSTFVDSIKFTAPDIYIVRAIAQDTKGKESDTSAPFQISIFTVAPYIDPVTGTDLAYTNEPASFSTVAYDSITPDSVYVRFMYRRKGVASYTALSWIGPRPTGSTFDAVITFTTPDTYYVRAIAKNGRGTMSDTTPIFVVLVINRPISRPWIDSLFGPMVQPLMTFANRKITFRTRAYDTIPPESVAVRFMYRKIRATSYTLRTWSTYKISGSEFSDSINFPLPAIQDTYIVRAIAKNKSGGLSDTTPPYRVIIVGWEFQTDDEYGFNSSPALGQDAIGVWRLFIGGTDGYFYILRASDGYRLERVASVARLEEDEEILFNASPAVNQGLYACYCGSQEGELYCISATGARKWRYPGNIYDNLTWEEFGTSAAISAMGNRLYVACDNDTFYALQDNGATCTKLWTYRLGAWVSSSPALDDSGNIYFGDDSGYVTSLSSTGSLRWRRKIAGGISASSPTIVSNRIYIGTDDGYLCALNLSTGDTIWRYGADDAINSSPVVGPDGTIYFGCDDGQLYALSSAGVLKPGFPVQVSDDYINSTPAIASNGTIVVYTSEDIVWGISPNGDTLWQIALPWNYSTKSGLRPAAKKGRISFSSCKGTRFETLYPSPTIGPDGTIYVASVNAGVYAIRGMTSPLATPSTTVWPKFRHDLRNTGRVSGSK